MKKSYFCNGYEAVPEADVLILISDKNIEANSRKEAERLNTERIKETLSKYNVSFCN